MASKSLLILLFLCGCATGREAARTEHSEQPARPDAPVVSGAPRNESALPDPVPPITPDPPLLVAGQRIFVIAFEAGSDDISAEMENTIQEAARVYRETGAVVVALSEDSASGRPVLLYAAWTGHESLLDRRVEAAQLSLLALRVWSRPVVRAADSSWREWSPGDAGPVYLLLGPRRDSQQMPPPVSGDPGSNPRGDRSPRQLRSVQLISLSESAIVQSVRPSAALAGQAEWLFEDRTLLSDALEKLLAECRRQRGRVTAECAAAARSGLGGFAGVPAEAIDEFVFLTQRCAGIQDEQECIGEMRIEREYRALNRGRLDPGPLAMAQGKRMLFTAKIRYDETIRARPGVQIGEEGGSGAGVSPQTPAGTIIPYTREMCFTLKAEQDDAFAIERVTPECVKAQPGGRVLFDPQWWVTPKRSGRLGLVLVTELVVNGQKRDYPHDPTPLVVEVTPAPDWLDRVNALIDRLTDAFNRATGLAKAIGALFAAVAAWGIWSLFRRPARRRRAQAEASAGTGENTPADRKPRRRRRPRGDEPEEPA